MASQVHASQLLFAGVSSSVKRPRGANLPREEEQPLDESDTSYYLQQRPLPLRLLFTRDEISQEIGSHLDARRCKEVPVTVEPHLSFIGNQIKIKVRSEYG
jgi:hypothetical protein